MHTLAKTKRPAKTEIVFAGRSDQTNPRFVWLKLPRFGKTAGSCPAVKPNQLPNVAPNCSVDVVGIQTPRLPESSGPPNANVGNAP